MKATNLIIFDSGDWKLTKAEPQDNSHILGWVQLKPVCCGQPMHSEPVYSVLDSSRDGVYFVCLDCGAWQEIAEGQLDEDDLESYKERVSQ
jgi:hypothetical protein